MKVWPAKVSAALVGGAVFCLAGAATAILTIALPFAVEAFWSSDAEWAVVAQMYLPVVLAVVVGYLAARRVVSRRTPPAAREQLVQQSRGAEHLAKHLILIALASSYFLTWAFGSPAAQTALTRRTVEYYKQLQASDDPPRGKDYPWLRSSVSFPLAPGVVATYYENQLAGLNGWGGWVFHFWYVTGVKELGFWTFWLS